MSTAGIIKVSAACPMFDGTEYPYWKNKMCMHLEAIDIDLWYVVENGVPKAGEGVTEGTPFSTTYQRSLSIASRCIHILFFQ